MRNSLQLLSFLICLLLSSFSFAGGGPSPNCNATPSGTCATATLIVSGAACTNGSTASGGGASGASACIIAGYECSWYSFVATASSMYVSIGNTVISGCFTRSEVFRGSCGALNSISCLSGAPLDDVHVLTGLIVGNTYFVSVCYAPGGPCGNGGCADFCIEVGEPDPPCDLCTTPCGTAAGYPTNPTVQNVVDDCQTSPFIPELQASSTNTFCYDFQATNTSVDFNVIITSNCGSGNVINMSWELYDITCGAPIQTGTLASMTFSPVVIGNQYVFCYTFDVPSTCTHSQHCPFFVGATPIVLSTDIISFEAKAINNIVELEWISSADIEEYDRYEIERSAEGIYFEKIIDYLPGFQSGNEFYEKDKNPLSGTSYYRIKSIKTDGHVSISDIVSVNRKDLELSDDLKIHKIYPMPSGQYVHIDLESGDSENININLVNSLGELVFNSDYKVISGQISNLRIDLRNYANGVYTLILKDRNRKKARIEKIIKSN